MQTVRGNTLRQQTARRVVTRQRRRAGRNQVAHTGKTAHRRSLAAQRHRQTGNLRQAASHNGRLRVITVIAALTNTHAKGNHVLHQAANFGTHHIRVGVRAEVRARNRVSNRLSHRQGTSRNHGGGRLLPHDFLRQVRAREHAHAVRNMTDCAHISTAQSHSLFQFLGNDLRHAQTRTGFQSLRQRHQHGIRLNVAGEALQLRTQNLRGQGKNHNIGAGQRSGGIRREVHVVRQLHSRKIAGVLASALALSHHLLITTDEGHASVIAALAGSIRRDLSESGAPATGAEHRNRLYGCRRGKFRACCGGASKESHENTIFLVRSLDEVLG